MEGMHLMSYDRLVNAADFIDRARDASSGRHTE
jgi:hypothetical protein